MNRLSLNNSLCSWFLWKDLFLWKILVSSKILCFAHFRDHWNKKKKNNFYSDKLTIICFPKVFKKEKDLKKGIAFPTCISVNNCVCHFSPTKNDPDYVLKAGDVVKMYVFLGFNLNILNYFWYLQRSWRTYWWFHCCRSAHFDCWRFSW